MIKKVTSIVLALFLGFCLVKSQVYAIEVSDIAVCENVQEHEPIGKSTSFSKDKEVLYVWTKIAGAQVPTDIKHIWYYNDEKIAEVPLNIKYETMRTYSSKKMMAQWEGDWKVEVVDSQGNLLKTANFSFGETATAEAQSTQQNTQETAASTEQKEDVSSQSSLDVQIKFGTGVVDREISGESASFNTSVGEVYCWSEVKGAEQEMQIKHIWYHNGQKITEVPLAVKYIRHRTFSSKKIMAGWIGDWKVEVVDANNNLLSQKEFTIVSN